MGMPEFNDGHLGEVVPLPDISTLTKFKALIEEKQEQIKRVHYGEIDELQRFKDMREAQVRIEDKLNMIIKHFNIVPIIGERV